MLWCDGRRTLDLPAGRPYRGDQERPPRAAGAGCGPRRSPIAWWPSSTYRPRGWRGAAERRRESGTRRDTTMLEELRISSLGVIDDAPWSSDPGLNVVTGETGAGKTMVVTALGSAAGCAGGAVGRPPGRRAGPGRGRARRRAGDHEVVPRAEEAGGVVDDGRAARQPDGLERGRSRATAGGASVPAGVLGLLTGERVVVHGQADQQRLLLASRQRDCLDAFGGAAAGRGAGVLPCDVPAAGARSAPSCTRSSSRRRERAQEADLLRFGLAEIVGGRAAARRGCRAGRRGAAGWPMPTRLRSAAETARTALAGDESTMDGVDALSLVATARKALDEQRTNDPVAGRARRHPGQRLLRARRRGGRHRVVRSDDRDRPDAARRRLRATRRSWPGSPASTATPCATSSTGPGQAGRAAGRARPTTTRASRSSAPSRPTSRRRLTDRRRPG